MIKELVNYNDWVLISDGGNSKVYTATYSPLNKTRIIKIINKNESGEETYYNEIDIMSRIKHRFIPQIYEVGERDDCYYIVMEYFDGVTLREYVRLHKTVDIRKIIIKLCHIVEFLHNLSEPILVLDIQPTNIIINNDEIYLIDFGNSKCIETVKKSNKKRRKFHFGTIGFASPEQFGIKEVNRSTDIYAIGRLILEFSNDEELKEIAYRCIGISAKERYKTVSSLIKDLTDPCINEHYCYKRDTKEGFGNKVKKLNEEEKEIYSRDISVFGIKEGVGTTTFAIGLTIALRKEGYLAFYIPRDPSVLDNLRDNLEVSYEERRENGYIARAYYVGDLAMVYNDTSGFISMEGANANKNKNKYNTSKLKPVIYVYDCGRYRRTRYYKGIKFVILSATNWSGEIKSSVKKLIETQGTLGVYNQCGINVYRKASLRDGINAIRMPFAADIMDLKNDKELTRFYERIIDKCFM